MFGQDRQQLRLVFAGSWQKHKKGLLLTEQENIIVNIIKQHPEYHDILEDENTVDKDFGADNPFLHLSLHLAVQEQLSIDSPQGILETYNILLTKLSSSHLVEHEIMNCLMQVVWKSQKEGKPLDEKLYLNMLNELVEN